jgi:fatty-acyl-CoA synthase
MTVWKKQTLYDVLQEQASWQPQAEALVISGRRLNYLELKLEVDRYAQSLTTLGVRHGDHIAVLMGNSLEWVIFFYAAASLGAITVPVNTRFKTEELKYCLEQSDVKLLFMVDEFLKIDFVEMLHQICPDLTTQRALPHLKTVVVLGENVPPGAINLKSFTSALGSLPTSPPKVNPDDVLLIQFTSGSTAYPKGVMLTHDNMLRNAAYVSVRFDFKPTDRYYSARPFYHVAGTTLSLLSALTVGGCLVSSSHYDALESLKVMSTEKCTLTSGNDTMFLMALNHPDFSQYPLCLRGGWVSCSAEVSRKLIKNMGMKGLTQAYGLSEASPNVSMSWHNDDEQIRIDGWGHILDDLEVKIIDPETGANRPTGESGEIVVRGWSLMKGYYKMPEQTHKAIDAQGWLHTGDLGVMDEHNRLRFQQRLKDVFRVGGENVAPAEVEELLHQHEAILQAQVVGVPDPRLGEVAAAYVVLREGYQIETSTLIDWCKTRIANFRVPRYIKIITSFEHIGMTGSVKIQKNKVRAQALIDFKINQ